MLSRLPKQLLVIIGVVSLLFVLSGCRPYDFGDFIGLTSAEIIEGYGAFDHTHNPPGEDGLYRNTMCGYMVKDAQVRYLGTNPPEYFLIYFDQNGIAYKCTYETGGWGG